MNTELLKVSVRQKALFIPNEWTINKNATTLNETTMTLVANCTKLGFAFSEDLLYKVNAISPKAKLDILEVLKEITGVRKNWTPLVKQWDVPTGESIMDHIVTLFANVFKSRKGTKLACGHLIPDNTFPLDRYNGCPFCGTPFVFDELDYEANKSKIKTLDLWTEDDLANYMNALLTSAVALDATQVESLKTILSFCELPTEVKVGMKETAVVVIDSLVEQGKANKASVLFKTPNDILRYLWYKNTGFLQIITPKVIARKTGANHRGFGFIVDQSSIATNNAVKDLKLKFTRPECRMYANWLNSLTIPVEKQCEIMHPKRGMWIRVIRALRLAEYSKRPGYERLHTLMDYFYNEVYDVWQGDVNEAKLKGNSDKAFKLLKQRPGLFARSLFSTMLWFGKETTLAHFNEIIHELPPRLVFTLNMYADVYFDKNALRTVKPLGGNSKRIPANKMLQLYSDKELKSMQSMVQDLSLEVIKNRFTKMKNVNKTIYIDENLYRVPIAIGDRSEHIQDLPAALVGTRFPIEGDTVRLFLQWGEGLPAQHLDMDLSCMIAYENSMQRCSYSQLVTTGCKHSGDIQRIPKNVGTAEYIDINIDELSNAGAQYVSFTCNAYSNGSISPNVVIGWMNSQYKMKVTKSGVAYNPTEVQHQLRIKQSLTKGMVFGVLDVKAKEIIWLEMPFGGQVVQNLDYKATKGLLIKLDAKLKLGALLKLKAKVQNLQFVDDPHLADEVYDTNWALKTGEVNELFLA